MQQLISLSSSSINCHIIAAALHFFGMKEISDSPIFNALPSRMSKWPDSLGQSLLVVLAKVAMMLPPAQILNHLGI
jgi:hypothetical protein